MNIEIIAEHSVRTPVAAGFVLDAGARSFTFSKELARSGSTVFALDPDPTINDPGIAGVTFCRLALRASGGTAFFEMSSDPQARHLSDSEGVVVTCTTIQDLMKQAGVDHWSVVKLDIEGAEYGVLSNWPGPIADQITVEFHEHCFPQPSERYDEILRHLGQWYDLVQHEKSIRHCIGTPNYWDSLWVKR